MRITDSCYIITGLNAESPWAVNSGFVVGANTTLIVDTGSNYFAAQTIFGYAHCAKPKNKIVVVNTEPHFDHIGGNDFFRSRKIDVYAHPNLKRTEDEFQRNKSDFDATIVNGVRKNAKESDAFYFRTALANPNGSVVQNDVMDLGGLEAVMYETPGHTPQNISIFIPKEKVLFCGDAVVGQYIPNLEGGNVDSWKLWLESLNSIEALNPEFIVPGHGDKISGKIEIQNMLTSMRTVISDAVEKKSAPTCRRVYAAIE